MGLERSASLIAIASVWPFGVLMYEPFIQVHEIVQIDLKYVVDQKALSLEQTRHFHSKQFPLYQWSAIDVTSRFKLMAYSYQKS